MTTSPQIEEPSLDEVRQMAVEYKQFATKETSRSFKRRAFIIGVALERYAASMEQK